MIFLVLIVAFLLYGLVVYARMRSYIRVGVGIAAAAVAYEQHPEQPTARLLTIGDSSVVGVGAEDSTLSVAGLIGSDFPTVDIENRGVSGMKLRALREKMELLASGEEGARFDVILIQIGGNDIVRFTPYKEIESDIDAIVVTASKLSDRVVIMHGGDVGTAILFPAPVRYLHTKRTLRVREIYMATAAKHDARYVDIIRAAKEDPFRGDPEQFYAKDFFHPSGTGYAYWYTRIRPQLEDVLSNAK